MLARRMNRHRLYFLLLNIGFSLIFIGALSVYNAYGNGLDPVIENKTLLGLEAEERGYTNAIIKGFFDFYKTFVSPIIGERCRMKPSCSSYSYQAFIKYGFIQGGVLTFDRLLHERDEYKVSKVVFGQKNIYDGSKNLLTFDPLDNNVFWWNLKHFKEVEHEQR